MLVIALGINACAWGSNRFLAHIACEPLLLVLPVLALPFLPFGGAPPWSARTRTWMALVLALLAWNACIDLVRAEAAVVWPRLAAHALAVLGAGMVLTTSVRPAALIAASGLAAAIALAVAAGGGFTTYVAHPLGMQAMDSAEPLARVFGNLVWLITLAGPALLAWLALTWPAAPTTGRRRQTHLLAGAAAAAAVLVIFQRGSDAHSAWEAAAMFAAHAAIAVLAVHLLYAARNDQGRPGWLGLAQGAGVLALLTLSLNTGRRSLALLVLLMLALPVLDRLRARRPRLTALLVLAALALGLGVALAVLLGDGPGRHRERLQIARAGIASAETSALGQGDCASLRLHERDPDLGSHLTALGKTINHMHNEWLECWLATGPFGLLLLSAATLVLAVAAWAIPDPRLRRAALLLAGGAGIAAATENSFASALGCTWLGMACGLILRAADAAGTGTARPRLDGGLRLLLLPPAGYCALLAAPAMDAALLGRGGSLSDMIRRFPEFSDPYAVTALGAAILGQPGVDSATTEGVLAAVTTALGPIPWGTGPFDLRLAQSPPAAHAAIAAAAIAVYPYDERFYQYLQGLAPDPGWPASLRRRLALLAGAPPTAAELAPPATVEQSAILVCAVRGAMRADRDWPVVQSALTALSARYEDPKLTMLAWEALLRTPEDRVAALRDALLASPLAGLKAQEAVTFLRQHGRPPRVLRLLPLLAQAYPNYWRAAAPSGSPQAARSAPTGEPGAAELTVVFRDLRRLAGE